MCDTIRTHYEIQCQQYARFVIRFSFVSPSLHLEKFLFHIILLGLNFVGSFLVLVLLSAHIERLCVSGMRDCFLSVTKPPLYALCLVFKARIRGSLENVYHQHLCVVISYKVIWYFMSVITMFRFVGIILSKEWHDKLLEKLIFNIKLFTLLKIFVCCL